MGAKNQNGAVCFGNPFKTAHKPDFCCSSISGNYIFAIPGEKWS
jgi:hypothetical protein